MPVLRPASRNSFLAAAFRKCEIVLQNVFDPEKDVAESRLAHQRRQRLAMHRDGRGHRLHGVDDVVQAGIDDGLAERLEALDVEADVVVDDENGAGAVVAGVANVGQHAVEGVSMKVAAAHLDDGAEAAIEGAAARRLDHVDRPSHHGVVVQYARVALGQANLIALQAVHRTRGIFMPAVAGPIDSPRISSKPSPCSIARSNSRKVISPSPRTM